MKTSFELFTVAGEELASHLIRGICQDVEADQISRRRALDRMADAMERVSGVDDGVCDPEPLRAFASELNRAFAAAGYVPVGPEDLLRNFEQWSKKGTPVDAPIPVSVERVGSLLNSFVEALKPVFALPGVSAAVSRSEPWAAAFRKEAASEADIVFYTYRGDLRGDSKLGCIFLGEQSMFLEDVFRDAEEMAGYIEEINLLGDGSEVDVGRLARAMSKIGYLMDAVNEISSELVQTERLEIGIEPAADGAAPHAFATWDGEPVPTGIDVTCDDPLLSDTYFVADAAEALDDAGPGEAPVAAEEAPASGMRM